MKHLHVTGCRRSGTTLLFEMLATCFAHDAHCEHEQSVFEPLADLDASLYFSKKPSDITHVKRIFERNPNLFLIYVLRDPRAVITSIHPSRGDVYYASFERWLRYEKAARELLQHERFLLVRYEELVKAPDLVQEKIQTQFPFLEKRHPFSAFHEFAKSSKKAEISLKGLRPISPDSLNNWQNHLPRIRFQLDRYPDLKDVVREYGYETNDDWLNQLEGITPRPQQYGEVRPHLLKKLESDLRYLIKSLAYIRRIEKEA